MKNIKYLILIALLSGCANIPSFYEHNLKYLEKKLIEDNKLEGKNLNITNCFSASTTLDDKVYNFSIPILDDPKFAIFYQGVCAIDLNTKIIYFEPIQAQVDYYKNKNLVKIIYPNWYRKYGYMESVHISYSKYSSAQFHLMGDYLYVLEMPKEKIYDFEDALKSLKVDKVELRRNIRQWFKTNVIVDNVR
jgi:hypothetical protein